MTSNSLKSEARKYAAEHGVNYTTALRYCTRYRDGAAGARADILLWGIPVEDGNERPNDWRFVREDLGYYDEGYSDGYRKTRLDEFWPYVESLPAEEQRVRHIISRLNLNLGHPHQIIAMRQAGTEPYEIVTKVYPADPNFIASSTVRPVAVQ